VCSQWHAGVQTQFNTAAGAVSPYRFFTIEQHAKPAPLHLSDVTDVDERFRLVVNGA
jgi:hypothetical protein